MCITYGWTLMVKGAKDTLQAILYDMVKKETMEEVEDNVFKSCKKALFPPPGEASSS